MVTLENGPTEAPASRARTSGRKNHFTISYCHMMPPKSIGRRELCTPILALISAIVFKSGRWAKEVVDNAPVPP
jgi:hypothetical protein